MKRLILLLALLVAAPVAADLGYQQAPQHAARYEKRYQSFPQRGKEVRAEVKEITDREFEKNGAPEWATGWYNSAAKPPELWLVIRKRREMVGTFCHEYGHHFRRTAMSEEERADWESFWETNLHLMPTDYAHTDSSEGFAECWEAYFMSRKRQYFGVLGPWRSSLNRKVERKLVSYFEVKSEALLNQLPLLGLQPHPQPEAGRYLPRPAAAACFNSVVSPVRRDAPADLRRAGNLRHSGQADAARGAAHSGRETAARK